MLLVVLGWHGLWYGVWYGKQCNSNLSAVSGIGRG